MLLRITKDRLVRRKVRVVMAIISVLVGAMITASLVNISIDVSEKMSKEFRAYGANIVVEPKIQTQTIQIGGVNYAPLAERRYVDSDQLSSIKTIFWRNNIVGLAPFLYGVVDVNGQSAVLAGTWFEKTIDIPVSSVTLPNGTVLKESAGTFTAGVRSVAPWWKIQQGEWVNDNDTDSGAAGEAIVGEKLAQVLGVNIGDKVKVSFEDVNEAFKVKGIVSTSGFEDQQIFVTLEEAQRILNVPNAVDKVLVSALVKPDDELARKPREKMTPDEQVVWYCSPYIGSVTYQIEEVLNNSTAKPIRQVSENEGKILNQTQMMFFLIAATALLASAIGVASTMMITVFERRSEIALMKAIGAEDSQISRQFFAEALLIGAVGGVSGYVLGNFLGQLIGRSVFGTEISVNVLSLPVTLAISLAVALLGCLIPVRRASSIEPAIVLKGG
ncbi:MAG: FtsX-like permease family protein [Thaumarchaeota archaeon]|nr:FtsX-like permease family protein [Nitrososphaerota archaeon]